MKHLQALKFWKLSVVGLMMMLSTACVVTPHGVVDAEIDMASPQIIGSTGSYVTVRLGSQFYASDAYLVAYNYCLDRGMYAYEVSPWAHSSSFVRDLRYDCRPTYIAPPMVYHVDRYDRFRYNYFRNYYRNHRPGYHYSAPQTGWWGRGGPSSSPSRPVVPRYSRDGRATTPTSPWSHNPHKNDRYQPRDPVQRPERPGWWGRNSSAPTINTPPPVTSPRPGSGFWGNSSATPTPKVEAPAVTTTPSASPVKPRGFWGNSAPKSSSGSPRSYSSDGPNRGSDRFSSGAGSSAPRSGGSDRGGSKPGWFGK